MKCQWCGCTTVDGNHGTNEECLKALERQKQLLAEELDRKRRDEVGAKDTNIPRRKIRSD